MAPFFTASPFVVIGTDRDRKLSEVTLPINKVERRDRYRRQDRATNRSAAGGAHAAVLIAFVCHYAPGFIE